MNFPNINVCIEGCPIKFHDIDELASFIDSLSTSPYRWQYDLLRICFNNVPRLLIRARTDGIDLEKIC